MEVSPRAESSFSSLTLYSDMEEEEFQPVPPVRKREHHRTTTDCELLTPDEKEKNFPEEKEEEERDEEELGDAALSIVKANDTEETELDLMRQSSSEESTQGRENYRSANKVEENGRSKRTVESEEEVIGRDGKEIVEFRFKHPPQSVGHAERLSPEFIEEGLEEDSTFGLDSGMEEDIVALHYRSLEPSLPSQRVWRWVNFVSLWTSLAIAFPTYVLGSTLLFLGLDWLETVGVIFFGNLLIVIGICLAGKIGWSFGMPLPIVLRSSFGILGSRLPILLRALIGVGWFSFIAWIGGSALYEGIASVLPAAGDGKILSGYVSVNTAQLVTYCIFVTICGFLILFGADSLKIFRLLASPLLLFAGLIIYLWCAFQAGVESMLDATSSISKSGFEGRFVLVGLGVVVGSWSLIALNVMDWSRYAKTQRTHMMGHLIGLPLTATIFAFIGISVTGASAVLFDKPVWIPTELIENFDNPVMQFFASLLLMLSALASAISQSIVLPTNDICCLSDRLTARTSGVFACLASIVIAPWHLFGTPYSYINWICAYSVVTGSIMGIMLSDYFVVRKEKLDMNKLYGVTSPTSSDNEFGYSYVEKSSNSNDNNNWVSAGIIALIISILPFFPGMIVRFQTDSVKNVSETWNWSEILLDFSWFISFVISFTTYLLISLFQNRVEKRERNFILSLTRSKERKSSVL